MNQPDPDTGNHPQSSSLFWVGVVRNRGKDEAGRGKQQNGLDWTGMEDSNGRKQVREYSSLVEPLTNMSRPYTQSLALGGKCTGLTSWLSC